ncbi:hypothetical protein, partial [Klebsiella sp. JB_Kp006]|uniref:hypothetical protein n=1 Tax=Klebsiella sp. JB_Kp006 TaxID=3153359 RepID=UPI0032B49A1F
HSASVVVANHHKLLDTREEWSPVKLQQRLNSDEQKRITTEQKKNRRTTGYQYFFSDTKLSEAHCCFCSRTGNYY